MWYDCNSKSWCFLVRELNGITVTKANTINFIRSLGDIDNLERQVTARKDGHIS